MKKTVTDCLAAAACLTALALPAACQQVRHPELDEEAPAEVQSAEAENTYRFVETDLPDGEVARFGESVITAGEVVKTATMIRKAGVLGHGEPEVVLESALNLALDRHIISERADEIGLSADPRVLRLERIYNLLYLGQVYTKEKILPKIVISETELGAFLPRSRGEIKARVILVLPEDAQEAFEAYRGGATADEIMEKFSLVGAGFGLKGDLGWIRQNETFFDREEEEYLWSLDEGTVSRPLDTPLGKALVVVEGKREIDDVSWKRMEIKGRERIAGEKKKVFFTAIVSRHPMKRDFKGIRQASEAAYASDPFFDTVVGTVGEMEIWFRDLERLLDVPYQDVIINAEVEQIDGFYSGYFRHVADRIALGLEAENVGTALGDPERRVIERTMQTAYLKVAWQDAIEGIQVTDEDVQAYWDEKSKDYRGVDNARLEVIVTHDVTQALAAVEEYRSGVGFSELVSKYSIDPKTRPKGGETGWVPVDSIPLMVRESLYSAAEGDLLPVFQTEQGYNVVRLMEIKESTPPTLESIRDGIARGILKRRRQEAGQKYLAALRGSVEIKIDRDELSAIEIKARPPQPVGGHGSPH